MSDWIKVKDKLPEDDLEVLICDSNNYISTGFKLLSKDKEIYWFNCDIGIIQPTHWMPLPEPPKEEIIL